MITLQAIKKFLEIKSNGSQINASQVGRICDVIARLQSQPPSVDVPFALRNQYIALACVFGEDQCAHVQNFSPFRRREALIFAGQSLYEGLVSTSPCTSHSRVQQDSQQGLRCL